LIKRGSGLRLTPGPLNELDILLLLVGQIERVLDALRQVYPSYQAMEVPRFISKIWLSVFSKHCCCQAE